MAGGTVDIVMSLGVSKCTGDCFLFRSGGGTPIHSGYHMYVYSTHWPLCDSHCDCALLLSLPPITTRWRTCSWGGWEPSWTVHRASRRPACRRGSSRVCRDTQQGTLVHQHTNTVEQQTQGFGICSQRRPSALSCSTRKRAARIPKRSASSGSRRPRSRATATSPIGRRSHCSRLCHCWSTTESQTSSTTAPCCNRSSQVQSTGRCSRLSTPAGSRRCKERRSDSSQRSDCRRCHCS